MAVFFSTENTFFLLLYNSHSRFKIYFYLWKCHVILAKIFSPGKVLNLWLLGRGTAKCWLCPKHSRHSRIQVKLQILVFMVNTRRSGSFHASIYTLTTWVAEGALTQLARHEGDGGFSQLGWWLHTEGVAARYKFPSPYVSEGNFHQTTFGG